MRQKDGHVDPQSRVGRQADRLAFAVKPAIAQRFAEGPERMAQISQGAAFPLLRPEKGRQLGATMRLLRHRQIGQ